MEEERAWLGKRQVSFTFFSDIISLGVIEVVEARHVVAHIQDRIFPFPFYILWDTRLNRMGEVIENNLR